MSKNNLFDELKISALGYFDKHAKEYLQEHYIDIDKSFPVLYIRHKYIINMLGQSLEGLFLDVGCGPGATLLTLAKMGGDAIGVDISAEMLKLATILIKRNSQDLKIQLIIADIERLPFRDVIFNGVISAGVIEYMKSDEYSLREISRIIKPFGTAIITVTNRLTPLWMLEEYAKISKIYAKIFRLMGRGKTSFQRRSHIPWVLSSEGRRLGLKKVDQAYFHFIPLPFPQRLILKKIYFFIGLKLESLSRTSLGFLGRGYIVKMVKEPI
jgi:ubiquinone/menaquinone biosynthesis C-methylase UbiE